MEKISFNQTKNRRMTGVTTRQILLSMCLIAFTCVCYAQDIIVTKNSTKIEVKVTEIDVEVVKFKMFDDQDGPLYSLPKSDVLTIVYQSGRVETFEQATAPATNATTPAVTAQPRTQSTPATTPTQRTPAYNSAGNGVAQNARPLSNAELMSRMSVNDPYLYSKYKSGSSLSSVGAGLTIGGLVAVIIGVAAGDKREEKSGGNTTVYVTGPGNAIASIGWVSALTGTPLWIVGSTKKRKARNAYLREYRYSDHVPVQSSPYLQLNAVPNGLGLAYIF